MEWNQVSEWFLKEIVTFGVRWIVVVVLGLIAGLFFGGFFGHRYRKVTLDIEALKKAGGTTVVHNHMPVGGSVNKCVNRHQAAFSWVTGLTGTPLTYWAPW